MVLGRFTIFLDNPEATYFPGQEITGNIHVWNESPRNVKGIYVECRGIARVDFTRREPRHRIRHRGRRSYQELENVTIHHRSNEEYFYQRVILRNEGNAQWELNGGRHQYPFSFTLPNEIPSSFEGAHGHVRYTIHAVFQRKRRWNYECKIPFTVNAMMDLNTISESANPVRASDFKTLGFWCCESKPIIASVWIERVGWVPGETIYFNAEVDNATGKTMDGSKVQLVEKTFFHAMGLTESHERVIFEQKRGHFNGAEFWENFPIIVPPVVPSELRFCRIIDVSYEIRFIVNPGPFSFNLRVAHKILIGNVPLRSSFANLQHNQQRQQVIVGREETILGVGNPFLNNPQNVLPVSSSYPDLPPPTYEECMFGGEIRDADDSEHVDYGAGVSYNPRYVTYR